DRTPRLRAASSKPSDSHRADLRDVDVCDRLDCFQFDEHDAIDHKIREKLADDRSVLIANENASVSTNQPALLPQAVSQRIHVDLFQETSTEISVHLERRLPNHRR